MNPAHLLTPLLLAATLPLGAQSSTPPATLAPVPTTRVLAISRIPPGVTCAQILPVMPREIRETVQLYLNGKLDQWYSRADGTGVVFLLNVTSVEEAHALLESLPLGRAKLLEFDLTPLGPLAPLRLLVQPASTSTPAK